MCVCVATLLASCQKQDFYRSTEASVAKTTAMEIFEQYQSKLNLTKTSSEQDVAKPLPGNFTPQWELAKERRVGDNTITTVPIQAQVSYYAVYPCSGNHSESEHNHCKLPVVQKLVTIEGIDSSNCYIVNIIPYENCSLTTDVINRDFIIGEELQGFNGFVAYHNLTGGVCNIEQYTNSLKILVDDINNHRLISRVTKDCRLYTNITDRRTASIINTKIAYNDRSAEYPSFTPCLFCGMTDCTTAHTLRDHCPVCRQADYLCLCLDVTAEIDDLEKCPYCRLYKGYPVDSRACKCVDWRNLVLPKCSVCNALNCYQTHKNNSSERYCVACGGPETCAKRPNSNGRHMVHADIIRSLFKPILSDLNLHQFQNGCQYVDNGGFSDGDEYKHALTYKYYTVDVKQDYEKLKSYFISRVMSFISTKSYGTLGEAFHPLFDCYITVNERIEFSIPYFVYHQPQSLINEQYLLMYGTKPGIVSNLVLLHNYIINLNNSTTSQQIGQLFEAWRITHSEEFNLS